MITITLPSKRSSPSTEKAPSPAVRAHGWHWLAPLLVLAGVLHAGGVYAAADLGITVSTDNETPVAGGAAFSYTITVTNHGPDDAQNILVTEQLPADVDFFGVAVVNNPSVPGYGLVCVGLPLETNGTVTCRGNLPGASPSTSVITITARIERQTASGVRTNTVQVASDTQEAEPNTNPNSASVVQNIQVNAPLSITLSGPTNFVPGENVVYRLAVNNGGGSTAINATISDPLPPGTTFLSMFGTGPFHDGCSHNAANPGVLTCAAVEIPSGLHVLTLVVSTAADTASPLENTATITTPGTGSIAVGSAMTSATYTP
jgi:uncharacterized repeat protein (TIGR01451 family)